MARTKLFLTRAPPKVQVIPKLRHKEEKKKIIRLCLKKLKTIDDTESLLCKSVLIVNTIRKVRQSNNNFQIELVPSNEYIENQEEMDDRTEENMLQ